MPQDAYAEFGGQTIEATAANDPYAEFGGQTITQPGESAFVTNRPQLPTPSEVIAPLAQGMQPDTTSAFTGNRFTITPQAGESFSDTMNRAAQAGKTVTPQEISSQGMKGLKESPAVLAVATAIGATLPAMAAGMGELAAPTTQTVTRVQVTWRNR